MVYWILPAALALRPRLATRREFALPLVSAAAVFSLSSASSLWLVPAYTLDQSTVHRALLAPSLLAATWIAALITERLAPPSVNAQGRDVSVERAA
jgi:hypothetical protein